jgi:hypothetical protein
MHLDAKARLDRFETLLRRHLRAVRLELGGEGDDLFRELVTTFGAALRR